MSTFWQMDGGAEREANSSIAEEKTLTPEAAEAILTGLAGTYAKDFEYSPDHSALFIISSTGSTRNRFPKRSSRMLKLSIEPWWSSFRPSCSWPIWIAASAKPT